MIFGSHDHSVRSLNAASGTLNWEIELDGEIQFGPVVSGGIANVGTLTGTLYAIGGGGPEPNVEATLSADPPAVSTPVIQGSISARLVWETSGADSTFVPISSAVARDGTVYSVDYDNQRIAIFSAEGVFQSWWGIEGSDPGEFRFADANGYWGAISIDDSGNSFVFDSNNHRVQKFGPDRSFITQWGSFGTGNGQFTTPMGLANTSNGLVYVPEVFNHRIQVFDSEGTISTNGAASEVTTGNSTNPLTSRKVRTDVCTSSKRKDTISRCSMPPAVSFSR